jgi:hypothetical protein
VKLRVLTVIVSTATVLNGCQLTVPGHLYPVQGPAAAQNPPPIYSAFARGLIGEGGEMLIGGTLVATLENNDSCSGNWNPVPTGDNTAGQMSVQWDQVYGPGFFLANVLGNSHFARATLTCKSGGALNLEFFDPNSAHSGNSKGVARDAAGNLYKVTF